MKQKSKRKTQTEIINKIHTDPDFFWDSNFDNSLVKAMSEYKTAYPDKLIPKSLKIQTQEYKRIYKEIMAKIKEEMKEDNV